MNSAFPLLSTLLLLPLAGALAVFLAPDRGWGPRLVAGLAALAAVVAAAALLIGGDAEPARAEVHPWLVLPWPANYHLGVDGLNLFLVGLTALLTCLAVPAMGDVDRPRTAFALILLLEATTLGVFLALDLVLFAVFWELMLVPAYLLMVGWGGAGGRRAALQYVLYNGVGGLALLVGIVGVGATTGTFDLAEAATRGVPATHQGWLFAVFALAFLVKTPIFPFHTWSPTAYAESPAPVAAILSGSQSKAGLYAFLRIAVPLFPDAARAWAPALAGLALISVLYGGVTAFGERDARRLLAYSSLSHLGLVALGVFSLQPQGAVGATLQMVNHGLFAAALFLLVGMVEERCGSRDLDVLGGLARRAPVLATLLIIAGMAALGLPGLNGFAGELLTLAGVYAARPWWAILALPGLVLAALYTLRLVQGMLHGPAAPPPRLRDLNGRELAAVLPLVLAMIALGLRPAPLPDRIAPAVHQVMEADAGPQRL
ncbi:MAG: NADH-quinone oxidoreductase subunit M [Clostridia bacterium]|nr:NADH-quinone oxidoreductase subunit M [Clostridia bacterium]